MLQNKTLWKIFGCTLKGLSESFITCSGPSLRSRDYLNSLFIIKSLISQKCLCLIHFHDSFMIAREEKIGVKKATKKGQKR
jgi:hypothetical protein